MNTQTPSAAEVLARLTAAMDAHDLDALTACFAPDYRLTDPAHPSRSFTGSAQVRKTWGTLFDAVPDISLVVTSSIATDDAFWLEGRQVGTRRDGAPVDNTLVFVAAVSGGRITSARIYVTPVEGGGPDVDGVIGAMAGLPGRAVAP